MQCFSTSFHQNLRMLQEVPKGSTGKSGRLMDFEFVVIQYN